MSAFTNKPNRRTKRGPKARSGTTNVHVEKVHDLGDGRRALDMSPSWARTLGEALSRILAESPGRRHVSLPVPKRDGDVRRLFHSADGHDWRQVHLPRITSRRVNNAAVVRGTQELDGDPAFSSALTEENLLLREQAGRMVDPPRGGGAASMADLVDRQLRELLDAVADRYVAGATHDQAREGRRMNVVTIERLIRHLRHDLADADARPFLLEDDLAPGRAGHNGTLLARQLHDFFVARHVPFLTRPGDLRENISDLPHTRRVELGKGVWADAARMPRDARFDHVYGALLRQAEGHPIFGDADYRRLEALLSDDLAAGCRVVRIDGRLFVRSENRWRPARVDPAPAGEAVWDTGVIVSRNHGRVIVPPHCRDGQLVPGYTRNGPGEGPSRAREAPVELRCLDRPIPNTNLGWLHAYHAWELGRG